MRAFITFCLCLCSVTASAAELKEVWTVNTGLMKPESAWYDPLTKIVYVSNIGTAPDKKDGTGYISKYDTSGKVLKEKWITGLNSPKGIRGVDGLMMVSAVDEIVVIDSEFDKINRTMPVEGAKFLNDVAMDSEGNFYISDTGTGVIHRVDPSAKLSVFVQGPETQAPNGLLVKDGALIVGGWMKEQNADGSTKVAGQLMSFDLKTKERKLITPEPLGNLDGLEVDEHGHYLVSDWFNGKVFHVTADGKATTLLSMKQGTADHAYIPEKRLLILPRMMEDKLTAYELVD
ncbi:SMP-30/gluconolactonase/LRE family protein [Planctomyces sp. SH-PL14]|uniref:SMP-30/gluconolactonase/LRE family protein n=1 Tax=Planctomyces sp. SH-PL14 TaxID=1632864 RepID=UPI00078CB4DB|nr:SMP-30/gluconolactonase/LRE family protein [Planctomyces sp. SH-PL14]AMV19766.1 SMP-30/Gluconolaconase/LRE-like region [Planctomyces sp. SH-PL14]